MEQKHQYYKYKDTLKKQCIFSSVGSAVALLSIVLLVFIPFFAIKIGDETISTLSIYDAIKEAFSAFDSQDSGTAAFTFVFGFYQIIAFIFLITAVIMLSINVAKGLGNITNIENYTLETYDNIKHRRDGKQEGGRRRRGGALQYFISAIVWEGIYILICRNMLDILGEDVDLTGASDFLFVNGIEMTIIIPLIFVVGALVLLFMANSQLRSIKTSIIKEEYDEEAKAKNAQFNDVAENNNAE